MSVQLREIVENFPELLSVVRGSTDFVVQELQAPSAGHDGSLIFIANALHLREASPRGAWVVHKDLVESVPSQIKVVLSSPNVQYVMSQIGHKFFPLVSHYQPIEGPKIHPSAQVSPTAKLGKNVTLGPGAVIGDYVTIGDDCFIGANAVIEPNSSIGHRTHIFPLVFVGHSCEIGSDCEIHPNTSIGSEGFGFAMDERYRQHRITHYGKVIIEDRVRIGSGVQVDRGTYLDSRIGEGTKIDNHCHLGHNIQIGKNTVITAGLIVAGSVSIGSYCVFGGRTTVGGHLEIADKTKISAMSVVSKGIDKPGDYGGFPLQDLRDTLKTRAALRHLPELMTQVKKIMKHLGLDAK